LWAEPATVRKRDGLSPHLNERTDQQAGLGE
jgi:hypothetical protein